MPHPAAQAVPILTVAAALGLPVSGRKARCFNGSAHKSGTDNTPALVFLTDVNRYKCHACGVHGDAIDLVKAVRNVSFKDAVDFLFGLTGTSGSSPQPARLGSSAADRTPNEKAKEVYATLGELSYRLSPRSPGGKYLQDRGIGLEVAHRLHVSELPDPSEIFAELTNQYTIKRLRTAGLLSQKGHFLFGRHSLLFFYFLDGRPQFIQARDITGEASCKELSLAAQHSPVPYNVDVLKNNQGRVLVCEGCVDTLSAAQLGYEAVGVPGVTGFREQWFELFRNVDRVTIVFDNDEAGRGHGADLRSRFRMRRIKADTQFPRVGEDVNDLLKSLSIREV